MFLIVAGHQIHKAKMIKGYVASQQGRLKLFFLPPYSPHLNPDGKVWTNVKTRVAKRTVTDKHDLKQKVISALRRLQKLPKLVSGFFHHPDCLYALQAEQSA